MEMFLYLDEDTYMHRLDPRTKIFIMIASFAIALMFFTIPPLLIIGALIVIYGSSGKTLSNLNRIKFVLVMIGFFSVVIWSLMGQGETRILGPITLEGFLYGILWGLKLM